MEITRRHQNGSSLKILLITLRYLKLYSRNAFCFPHPLLLCKWKHHQTNTQKKTLIMQYALMHKWLEHLTHTNIHISLEEKIPQGWDGAICVRQTEHKENRPQSERTQKKYLFKRREMLQLSRGWQHLGKASLYSRWCGNRHTLGGVSAIVTSWWNVMCTQGALKCYLGELDSAVTQHSEISWREKNQEDRAVITGRRPQPVES